MAVGETAVAAGLVLAGVRGRSASAVAVSETPVETAGETPAETAGEAPEDPAGDAAEEAARETPAGETPDEFAGETPAETKGVPLLPRLCRGLIGMAQLGTRCGTDLD